jgi:hypothetical protein
VTTSSRARLFVIPLITLSITLVVLVVAIVIVVIVKQGGGGAGTPSASAAQIDGCVAGDWRVTDHREDVSISGVGPVTFTGKGADVHLGADGSGVTDFGHRTRFEGTVGSQKIRLDVTGTLRYHFSALNGTVSFVDMTSQATAQTYIDDVPSGSAAPFNGGTDPATYTCKGDTLVESTAVYRTELTRKK